MSIPLWLQCTHLLMATSSRVMILINEAQIISDWFLEHDNEFTLLKWPPQSPDLNPIEYFWDVVEREIRIRDVQPTNLQQLRDAIMSIWTNPCSSKVYLIKWPVNVYTLYLNLIELIFTWLLINMVEVCLRNLLLHKQLLIIITTTLIRKNGS